MDAESHQVRLSALGIVAVSLFLALFVRLWFLQGIDRQKFEVASASNRLRVIHEEGPRGRILDRNGKVLVDNRTSRVVSLDREPLRKLTGNARSEEFAHLADTLTALGVPTKVSDVQKQYDDKRYAPQDYVPIAEDVSEEVEIYLSERGDEYPGVVVETKAIRTYPYGELAAQLVGYVGEINEDELVARGGKPAAGATTTETTATTTTLPGQVPKPYQLGDTIGKSGVERSYEADLRAVPGKRTIEVNAKGDLVDVVQRSAPKAGDDVWLSIDIDLQADAERLLAAKIQSLRGKTDHSTGAKLAAPQGSVVIEDPNSGQVLAMASYPTYDPQRTVNGISSDLWAELNDPANGRPLYNWALQGTYAPGSTFKPFTAYAAMKTGFLTAANEYYNDGGSYKIKNCSGKCEFQNAGRAKHGRVNVSRSLTVSSDVYYYWIGHSLWLGRGQFGETPIQDAASLFGLGSRTGIPLPGESGGRMPTPAARKAAYEANPGAFATGDWFPGDNMNTAIGQGDVLVTPLQLANAYATLANGGTRYRPQIVSKVTRIKDPTLPPGQPGNYDVVREVQPDPLDRVPFAPEAYSKIFTGLVGVTQSGEGTASKSWHNSPTAWPMAGKTGTAQVHGKADTSVFAGWGPAVAGVPPQYAVSVIIPEAGFGGDVAAPLAFRILEPASKGQLPAACPVAQAQACALAEAAAQAASSRDVGSGGPG